MRSHPDLTSPFITFFVAVCLFGLLWALDTGDWGPFALLLLTADGLELILSLCGPGS